MGQHLYECEQCGKYGVAHYVLKLVEGWWVNVLLCTACWEKWKAARQAARAAK